MRFSPTYPVPASGVVRRHPDIKVLRRESDIRRLVHTRTAILDTLWSVLKPGGRLLYATCSLFVEENSAQIDAFLVRQPGAQRIAEERVAARREQRWFLLCVAAQGLNRCSFVWRCVSSSCRRARRMSSSRAHNSWPMTASYSLSANFSINLGSGWAAVNKGWCSTSPPISR